MTLRQVSICLQYIAVRNHNAYAAKAALQGHKIPIKHVTKHMEPMKLDPEQEAAVGRHMREVQERLRKDRLRRRG